MKLQTKKSRFAFSAPWHDRLGEPALPARTRSQMIRIHFRPHRDQRVPFERAFPRSLRTGQINLSVGEFIGVDLKESDESRTVDGFLFDSEAFDAGF